jgi:hypothetical protein
MGFEEKTQVFRRLAKSFERTLSRHISELFSTGVVMWRPTLA